MWTKTSSGCACSSQDHHQQSGQVKGGNKNIKTCACCAHAGACQCGVKVPYRCAQCGLEQQCDQSKSYDVMMTDHHRSIWPTFNTHTTFRFTFDLDTHTLRHTHMTQKKSGKGGLCFSIIKLVLLASYLSNVMPAWKYGTYSHFRRRSREFFN